MQFDFTSMDLIKFRDDLKQLRDEIEDEIKQDPSGSEEAIPLLTSIKRLLKELAGLKSNQDLKREHFLQCVPDLHFVMQTLNGFASEEDDILFADEDEEYDMNGFLIEDEEEDEEKPKKGKSKKKFK